MNWLILIVDCSILKGFETLEAATRCADKYGREYCRLYKICSNGIIAVNWTNI